MDAWKDIGGPPEDFIANIKTSNNEVVFKIKRASVTLEYIITVLSVMLAVFGAGYYLQDSFLAEEFSSTNLGVWLDAGPINTVMFGFIAGFVLPIILLICVGIWVFFASTRFHLDTGCLRVKVIFWHVWHKESIKLFIYTPGPIPALFSRLTCVCLNGREELVMRGLLTKQGEWLVKVLNSQYCEITGDTKS